MNVIVDPETGETAPGQYWAEGPASKTIWALVDGLGPVPVLVSIAKIDAPMVVDPSIVEIDGMGRVNLGVLIAAFAHGRSLDEAMSRLPSTLYEAGTGNFEDWTNPRSRLRTLHARKSQLTVAERRRLMLSGYRAETPGTETLF